jgi:hypothetical protein
MEHTLPVWFYVSTVIDRTNLANSQEKILTKIGQRFIIATYAAAHLIGRFNEPGIFIQEDHTR